MSQFTRIDECHVHASWACRAIAVGLTSHAHADVDVAPNLSIEMRRDMSRCFRNVESLLRLCDQFRTNTDLRWIACSETVNVLTDFCEWEKLSGTGCCLHIAVSNDIL